jgi:hypothetical protein
VPLRIVRRFTGRSGSAARTISNHESARRIIELEKSASAISTQLGLDSTIVSTTLSNPTRRSARKASSTPSTAEMPSAARRAPAKTRARRERGSGRGSGSSDSSRRARTRGDMSAGRSPAATDVRSPRVAGSGAAIARS